MRDYEITFIIHPNLEDEERTPLIEQVQGWITDLEGQVTKVDVWGQRKLAYEIDNVRQGFYVLMYAQLEGPAVRELERRMQLTEQIIRYLTVRAES